VDSKLEDRTVLGISLVYLLSVFSCSQYSIYS